MKFEDFLKINLNQTERFHNNNLDWKQLRRTWNGDLHCIRNATVVMVFFSLEINASHLSYSALFLVILLEILENKILPNSIANFVSYPDVKLSFSLEKLVNAA
jgi:hypothetical protein